MPSDNRHIAIIILAAGESKRLGQPKQLLPWGDHTLLEHAISSAEQIRPGKLLVILGGSEKMIRSGIDFGTAEVIVNRDFQKGMGTSIAAGARYLLDREEKVEKILMMLCDQPDVDVVLLQSLINQSGIAGCPVVATSYENRAGVPAIFDRSYLRQLALLSEDKGARELMQKYPSDVRLFSPASPLSDIDTHEDYRKLLGQ